MTNGHQDKRKISGFTLIEMMVVLTIISILLAIIPNSKLNLGGDLGVQNLMKFIRKGKVESLVKQKALNYRIFNDRLEKYSSDTCFGDPTNSETFILDSRLSISAIPNANQFCFNPNLKYEDTVFNIIVDRNNIPKFSLQILASGVVSLDRL